MEHFGKLEQCQKISEQMLGLAENNQWDNLPELELERKQLMQDFFSQATIKHSDRNDVEQVVKQVLAINDHINRLAEQQKLAIGEQIQGLKKRQVVHTAYIQNK